MAGYHIVEQGEHLSSIAKDNGFRDYHTIWDDPHNAQLKKQRVNPNVIFPGDSVFIPDKEQREESRNTTKRHQFVVRKPGLKLRLVLEDLYEKPIANAKCQLIVESEIFDLISDGAGKIEHDIPLKAKTGVLVIDDEQTPANDIQIPLKIGHLDPVDRVSGQKARLNTLGYFAGEIDAQGDAEDQDQSAPADNDLENEQSASDESDAKNEQPASAEASANDEQVASGGKDDEKKEQFRSAIEEFQCDHDLKVDGLCGPVTQAKLKQVHGC